MGHGYVVAAPDWAVLVLVLGVVELGRAGVLGVGTVYAAAAGESGAASRHDVAHEHSSTT